MSKPNYLFTSKVNYGDLKDELTLTTEQDVHLSAIIKLAENYAKLDDITKFDLHKLAIACDFDNAEQMIFSIHALGHLFVALLTSGVDLANGLVEKLGPVMDAVGNSIKSTGTGAPAWHEFQGIMQIAISATSNSMNSKPVSIHPAVDPSCYN